ncbi:MAG: hypothetical protein A3H96_14485 [Acidobacteria bacterium RIFCSPLOWO2_02_FULL_67_36]|nr:MAG: hypothetical protein A3H96_14485 [Acidobacteria bacterium RIFCSPLOWO2_02_FULL_67_36]OFW18435.1 MAG: hypothetical protein A3G21_07995 [Acidobacteria bacterium RIFCSPLOWO2_12_FULL_66_21]
MRHLSIVRPGMLTTIQDRGRWGRQASGVPVAGPMDVYSHRLANRLVGNDDDAAALEITIIGPELEAEDDMVCAIAGAEFAVAVDGVPAPLSRPFTLASGARLRFGERLAGARASLAVAGGIAVEPVFGSRATSVISHMGPLGGRPLVAGDRLPIGSTTPGGLPAGTPLPLPRGGATVRVILGPHDHWFTPEAVRTLLETRFVVTPQSNRMGYRLEGAPLSHSAGSDILSDATPIGSLQVPGSGQAILLMADRQTTGGYPKIATVVTADLPIAGQLAPGDWIAFMACTPADALEALHAQEARLAGTR